MPAKKSFDFEKSLIKLEEIVEILEKPNTGLDKSINYYEEGIKVYNECQKYLEEAQKKITVLTESIDK